MDYEKLIRNALARIENPNRDTRARVYRSALNAFQKKFGAAANDTTRHHRMLLADAIKKIEYGYEHADPPLPDPVQAPVQPDLGQGLSPQSPATAYAEHAGYAEPYVAPVTQSAELGAHDQARMAPEQISEFQDRFARQFAEQTNSFNAEFGQHDQADAQAARQPDSQEQPRPSFLLATAIVVALIMAVGGAYVYYLSSQPVAPIRVNVNQLDEN